MLLGNHIPRRWSAGIDAACVSSADKRVARRHIIEMLLIRVDPMLSKEPVE